MATMTLGERIGPVGAGAGPGPDRGQLVLISAILLAFIILGLVVAFNGVLYTDTVASGGAGESMDDVQKVEAEIVQMIQGLADELDEKPNPCADPANPSAGCFAHVIGGLESEYQQSKASERSAHVTIEGDSQGSDPTITYNYTSGDVSVERTLDIEWED